jgi:hypothetical protein
MNKHERDIENRLNLKIAFLNKRIRKIEANLASAYKERHQVEEIVNRLKPKT